MAKYYSGQDGKLFVDSEGFNFNSTENGGPNPVAKVRSWSFTLNTAVLETVSLGDFDRTIIPGISSVTGSCSIYYYAESTSASHNANGSNKLLSTKIIDAILPRPNQSNTPSTSERPKVKFRLQVDSNHYIDLNAVITSYTMQNSVGEIMSAEVNFEGDGIPTESTY